MKPRVSIIIPLYNDADHVAAALESSLSQTIKNIEVIAVDDASTDDTASIVEAFAEHDGRLRLVRLEINRSAFVARRVGIETASADHVLFLDGDDELHPRAAEIALGLAGEESADVVGFGCTVIRADGRPGGRYEESMQPVHPNLRGGSILTHLFPQGARAQGQLWRYLFDRSLLLRAYESLSRDLRLARVNDLPLVFLALMHAKRYVSTTEKLYRYHFRRGASGHTISSREDFDFLSSAIGSIDAICDAVHDAAATVQDSQTVVATYESVRLSVIGLILDYIVDIRNIPLREWCLEALVGRVGAQTVILAAADHCRRALPVLTDRAGAAALGRRPPRHILIRASNLGTGGAQGVVVAQARHLARAGFRVTIAVESTPAAAFALPDGVDVFQITGQIRSQRLQAFAKLCAEGDVDVIIDHYIFYNETWPYFALIAATRGIPTIGWLHNFALRPIVDGSTRLSFLDRHLHILATVVVLSEADVAYWKLRGFPQVTYLPNPPSPLLESIDPALSTRDAPDHGIELVWWGRLQQSTKQVREIIEITALLRSRGIPARAKIVGPDGPDLSAEQLASLAAERGIGTDVELVGAVNGPELLSLAAQAHIYVSTSVIEGYPLALVEAQALGLPIVMYELPWLATVQGNEGMVAVPQGDREAAADAIADLASDRDAYVRLSAGSRAAAHRATAHDYDRLYADLIHGRLAKDETEAPSAAATRVLFHQNVLFLERLIRRERRALDRARSERDREKRAVRRAQARLAEAEMEIERLREENAASMTAPVSRETTERPQIMPPSIARTGIRRLLSRIIPASMYQASFYARHEYGVSLQQYERLVANQTALRDQIDQLQALMLTGLAEPGGRRGGSGEERSGRQP
ncbi:glycosyltransferase [Microbacterium sp. NPDC077663]|uniref:glycosyltransferase n=1 Tax=Microbacterium sp. NPDC077663 TaxID=3364189 RepID=UPI0037C71709